jgi:hypothetical protein
MILLIRDDRGRRVRPQEQSPGVVSKVAGGVAAAAVFTVPVHGFVMGSGSVLNATAQASPPAAAAVGWMRTFFGACAWAFMIAAGSLVYNHFVGKWQEKGYPILPMAALAAVDSQPRASPIPLGHQGGHQQRAQRDPRDPRQQPQQPQQGGTPSYLDQYEG